VLGLLAAEDTLRLSDRLRRLFGPLIVPDRSIFSAHLDATQ
jgi:hypothetical protein